MIGFANAFGEADPLLEDIKKVLAQKKLVGKTEDQKRPSVFDKKNPPEKDEKPPTDDSEKTDEKPDDEKKPGADAYPSADEIAQAGLKSQKKKKDDDDDSDDDEKPVDGKGQKTKVEFDPILKSTECAESSGNFTKLEKKLSREKGVRDPGALAAAIGRKKYGAAKFAAMARG